MYNLYCGSSSTWISERKPWEKKTSAQKAASNLLNISITFETIATTKIYHLTYIYTYILTLDEDYPQDILINQKR